jgi:tetratricopeptide (TPR) repeat protein
VLRATWFYGEPFAMREVVCTMALPDGGVVERRGMTNAAGELPLDLPTTEFQETAVAVLEANAPGENARGVATVPIVTTELAMSVRIQRPVYLAGETLEASAEIKDQSGKPLVRDAELVYYRLLRDERRGALQEVEVARTAIQSDKDGKARATFVAHDGGEARVRIVCKDRFGNVVTSDAQFTVSGKDDELKLRLLADRETWSVGEEAVARVVNRAGKRLALLTWQADGILACESRMIDDGESRIALPMLPEHAPNFALSIAMVDGKKLHVAERPFFVRRELRVEVEAPKSAKPGETKEVVVRVRDASGKPVRAEIALAMVDESLLALHGDYADEIGVTFWGQRRETSFRTASSCLWGYDGWSRRVNAALLSEEARIRAAEQVVQDSAEVMLVQKEMQHLERMGVAGETGGVDKQSAFDSNQWNSAVGMGGGAGGRFGKRQAAGRPGSAGPVTGGAIELPSLAKNANGMEPAGFDTFSIGGGGFQVATDLYVGRGLRLAFDSEGQAVRRDFRETGAWIPSLVTDGDGVARAQIAMPDSTTSWRILARGVTADTWVGEGKASLRTQQDLQVEAVGPSVLTEGDEVRYAVRAHNLGGEAVDGEVRFEQKTGEVVRSEVAAMRLKKGEEAQREFAFSALTPGLTTVTARGVFGDKADAAEREAIVQPFGVERIAAWSGSSRDRAARELSLPIGGEYAWLRMTVELGGDPGRDLLRAALGQGFLLRNCVQSAPTNVSAASRGIAALVVLDWLEATNGALPGDRDRLLAQATASLQSLCAMQQDGGAFSWTGKKSIDARTTSQALRFFSMAVRRGMPAAIDPQNRAAESLLTAIRGADNDARADALWALASADRARFETMNSLHRARTSLQQDGLSRLALAWQAASRPELAAEALATLRPMLTEAQFAELGAETLALAARALLAADLRDAVGMRALNAVRERRVGAGWDTMEATAAAVSLLAKTQSTGAGEPRATEVTVLVNGRELATKPSSAQALSGAFVVPSEWLKPQGNAVQVQVTGGGEAYWSVTLAGFEKGFRDADRGEELAMVQRNYVAAPLRHDGKEVPAGFRCVQGKQIPTFAKEVTQLGVGESLRVETTFAIRQSTTRMRTSPIVVEEPLPAGCSVPRDSITGSFEHVEVAGDRIVLYFPEGSERGNVNYELQARHEGSFRALPTILYAALRPELRAMGRMSSLRIHARGQGARDEHRLTPDELLWLGKREYDAAQSLLGAARDEAIARAQGHLASLLLEWNKTEWRLRDDVAADCARMMLFLGIERGDGKQVVRFFEELKDRQPDLVIPFDKILGVGRAYFDLGEFESALLVFRGTEEASFLKDAAVATTLGELGEHKASTRFLEQLLLAYPDLPTMRTARYSIGQQLAAMAAERDPSAPVDARVGSAVELRRRAIAQLREFLVLCPEDPLAEEVAFAWATTLLEAKDLEGALAVAQAALRSYADSPFEDEQLYTVGYAQFALGRHEEAFAALQKVAQGTFAARGGGRTESESKWHAVYLQGQIWHARGETEKALLAYDQVKDRFTDAVEASDYFRQKSISLDEVSTFATGAPVEIAISYRNMERAQVQVFQVDLVRLYLVQKSLEDIRGIKLHGIAPMQSLDVELGTGRDYATKVKKVALSMTKPGAYLCVVRSGDRIATGMALVSDLRIEAQEQFAQGRIRVNVRRGDGYVVGAHVKIVGSDDGVVRSGDTDLRGVFVADGLMGRATALAALGDHYAIYRGEAAHGAPAITQSAGLPGQQSQQDGAQRFDALDNNFKANVGNRGSQVQWLQKEVMNKKQKGVEVFRTK